MTTLWITDHALRRFAELFPDHAQNLPKHLSHLLGVDGERKFRKALKAVLRIIPNTTRVTLPANKQWGKFLKHGVQKDLLLCAKDWTTFVIVQEGFKHHVVTITRPPKEKRDAETDDSVENPSGSLYMKSLSGIVVPYALADGVTAPNNGLVGPMYNFQIQIYYGKGDHDRKTAAKELPLQPG